MNFLKSIFIKLVTGRGPQIKAGIAAAATWPITWLVTKYGIEVPEAFRFSVVNGITAFIWGLINSYANRLSTDGIKKIQEIIPNPAVIADGHVGDVTTGNLKLIVNKAPSEHDVPLTAPERSAVMKANLAQPIPS